jgi:hypothetical protein
MRCTSTRSAKRGVPSALLYQGIGTDENKSYKPLLMGAKVH